MVQWLDRLWHHTLRVPFRLAYRVYGGTGDTVVLLHGIASEGAFWQPLITELQATTSFQIIVPDMLGHGKSPTPQYIEYSVDDQVRALLVLLRKLRVQRMVLVGHSMGCLIATRLASRHPEITVDQLVLYEPPLFTSVPGFETPSRRQQFYRRLYERIAENPAGKFTTTQVVAKVSKNWQRYLESDQTWLPIQRSLRNTIMNQKSFEELRDIAIKTNIVHGRLDVVVPPHGLRRKLASNKNIKLYRTTDRHRLSRASATMLTKLLSQINSKDEA